MVRLGDICRFQSGGTPNKNNANFYNGTIPWITTVALNGNTIGEESAVEWITDEAIQESSAKVVPKNSIMVGTRVGIGKVAINSVPMSTSQDIISLVGIDESIWDELFLCKFILSKNDFLISQSRGATIKGIGIDTLSNLVIPDILIDEQRKIAAVLDKVSDLMAKRRQQMNKLDELVKSRFIELFGDPLHPTQSKLLGDVAVLERGRFHPDRAMIHATMAANIHLSKQEISRTADIDCLITDKRLMKKGFM